MALWLCVPLPSYAQGDAQSTPPPIARLGVRVTSPPTSRTVSGSLFALDQTGGAVTDVSPTTLAARLDDAPVTLSLAGRPSIALAVGFWLDSSASPQVRDAVANALADGLREIDVNRDSVAIESTTDASDWDQASFTSSAADLQQSLNGVIQHQPLDQQATLERVSSALRSLEAQPADTRVLLLFANRPLASAASINASLGTIRSYAVDNGIQIGIVALPGTGGQGPAEALAEATPGGRVEYVLNATNRQDISRRVGLLLAPAFGAHRFELTAPGDGSHTLSVAARGVPPDVAAATTFQVVTRPVQVAEIDTSAGPLTPSEAITQPTWVEVRPSDPAPIDSVEWTLDGRVTQVTSEPWALLLDPEQLADGHHDLAARIISNGRAGPIVSTTIDVPPDLLRGVRNAVRNWGVIALLLVGELVVILLFLRAGLPARGPSVTTREFPPTLRLNPLAGRFLAPDVIEFPTRGKLRIGYHPPFMDNQIGGREFARLPYQDIRGDDDAVRDLSRHAACIWRDPRTNDCYIQLGWSGSGERIEPRPQSQVFHFGRPQDATNAPFRLAHHDVVRLSSGVEFVFHQVGLRDKATPESKKVSPLELRSVGPGRVSVLSEAGRRSTATQEGEA